MEETKKIDIAYNGGGTLDGQSWEFYKTYKYRCVHGHEFTSQLKLTDSLGRECTPCLTCLVDFIRREGIAETKRVD